MYTPNISFGCQLIFCHILLEFWWQYVQNATFVQVIMIAPPNSHHVMRSGAKSRWKITGLTWQLLSPQNNKKMHRVSRRNSIFPFFQKSGFRLISSFVTYLHLIPSPKKTTIFWENKFLHHFFRLPWIVHYIQIIHNFTLTPICKHLYTFHSASKTPVSNELPNAPMRNSFGIFHLQRNYYYSKIESQCILLCNSLYRNLLLWLW